MHPVRKQRLTVVVFVVVLASVAAGLLFYSLGSNLNAFYSPSEILEGKAPQEEVRIRAGGMVVKDSVERSTESLFVKFRITDGPSEIEVHYEGILPDLFAEGDAALVAGKLTEGNVFLADEVLAKHDENYTPPEIKEAMDKGHEYRAKQEAAQ